MEWTVSTAAGSAEQLTISVAAVFLPGKSLSCDGELLAAALFPIDLAIRYRSDFTETSVWRHSLYYAEWEIIYSAVVFSLRSISIVDCCFCPNVPSLIQSYRLRCVYLNASSERFLLKKKQI